ncbi:AMP-binding protein [Oscillatoriales cyanobacterium LEGE 11467]|uniref:AMP-binding protein n=1 Tax=Zarconia navalis LEGE 11467 TaxID=1828826 RepID=A0A928W0B6_9CYAN|nr:AMP-binding protein [Zarconia navalis]MBE9042152.1 AMP-binding protein [Zarconia navalis LEGE 11467]
MLYSSSFLALNPAESLDNMHVLKQDWNLDRKTAIGVISVNSIDFVNLVFDRFKKGQIVVFLQSETDFHKIQVTGVTEVVRPEAKFGWCDTKFTPQPTSSIAQISFTSGTTGQPKAVLLTHRALNDVVERLNSIMEVDASIREYVGVPTNYSFGLGRCRAVATAGGQFYIPENGFNPLEIREMLRQGSINAISAVPSLWRTLFQCEEIFGNETDGVRWIEIGSQYMSRAEKERLLKLFPKANIVQHYGLTEASRSTFLRIDRTRGEHLESVGKAYGNTDIKMSADGKIMIKGPHVAEMLLVEGQPKNNLDPNGWHTTNDLGWMKDEYVYYLGRADDLINCGGVKVSPDNIEKFIRKTLNIQSGIAVARAKDPIRGEVILVSTLADGGLDRQSVKDAAIQAAAAHNIHSPDAVKLMELDEFPTTATGKVKRKQLTELYSARLESLHAAKQVKREEPLSQTEDDRSLTDCEREIVTVWKNVLNLEQIDADSNFFEMGGDSLTAISVMVKMEKLGIPPQIVKGMLQGLSVRELARRIESTEDKKATSHTITSYYTKTGMNINIVRGLLVLCVIFSHWYAGFANRLPPIVGNIRPYISPILAAGTPGFAIIYGVSAGYSMFSIFQQDRSRLSQLLRSTFIVLAGGIVISALLRLSHEFISGQIQSLTDITNAFYSVLAYYLLITATLPFWFKAIEKSKNPAAKSILISILLYCFYYYFISGISAYEAHGFVELIKLVMTAKYSYFNLTAGTLCGIAIGITLRQNSQKQGIPNSFVWIGCACLAAGFVVCSHAGMSESWFVWPTRKTLLWGWLFYIGWILLGLDAIHKILSGYNQFSASKKFVLQALATVGILAFPLYVTHGMVLPLRQLMVAGGLPSTFSLFISFSLFLGSFAFIFKKIHSTNFTW